MSLDCAWMDQFDNQQMESPVLGDIFSQDNQFDHSFDEFDQSEREMLASFGLSASEDSNDSGALNFSVEAENLTDCDQNVPNLTDFDWDNGVYFPLVKVEVIQDVNKGLHIKTSPVLYIKEEYKPLVVKAEPNVNLFGRENPLVPSQSDEDFGRQCVEVLKYKGTNLEFDVFYPSMRGLIKSLRFTFPSPEELGSKKFLRELQRAHFGMLTQEIEDEKFKITQENFKIVMIATMLREMLQNDPFEMLIDYHLLTTYQHEDGFHQKIDDEEFERLLSYERTMRLAVKYFPAMTMKTVLIPAVAILETQYGNTRLYTRGNNPSLKSLRRESIFIKLSGCNPRPRRKMVGGGKRGRNSEDIVEENHNNIVKKIKLEK